MDFVQLVAQDCPVSIHAPARGATSATNSLSVIWECFNPRPRAGGDIK